MNGLGKDGLEPVCRGTNSAVVKPTKIDRWGLCKIKTIILSRLSIPLVSGSFDPSACARGGNDTIRESSKQDSYSMDMQTREGMRVLEVG